MPASVARSFGGAHFPQKDEIAGKVTPSPIPVCSSGRSKTNTYARQKLVDRMLTEKYTFK